MKGNSQPVKPVPPLSEVPADAMTNALAPGKTFYVAPGQIGTHSGQMAPGMPMLNKPAGTARVPVVWNGVEWVAKPFKR